MNRLEEIAEQISAHQQPPVHLWKPELVGTIDIRIDHNGAWFHEGEQILREKLVALFASILWFEDGQHYLVTPAEKLSIEVADSPFVIHQIEHIDDTWVAVTNTHQQIIIGDKNQVTLREYQGQWLPYVNVRYDLWARVNRSIYFQWVSDAVDIAEQENTEEGELWLSSSGYRFRVGMV